MRTDNSHGTFNDVIRGYKPPIKAIARKLRKLMAEVLPDAVELPLPAEQHVSYGIGPNRAREIFGYICPLDKYVRLGFYYGGGLPDPAGLLQGEGKRLRHIKIYSLAEGERPEVRRLLEQAVRERKAAV
jgi:hypothetical protein